MIAMHLILGFSVAERTKGSGIPKGFKDKVLVSQLLDENSGEQQGCA